MANPEQGLSEMAEVGLHEGSSQATGVALREPTSDARSVDRLTSDGDFSPIAKWGGRPVVAHDYITQRGGAERFVLNALDALPGSRVVTTFFEPAATYPEFGNVGPSVSRLNRLAFLREDPRRALPILPMIFSRNEVRDAPVVLCSSSGWSHMIKTDAPKVVYCHNTPRWLYQADEYLAGRQLRLALAALRPYLSAADRRGARSATLYLANSRNVAQRIRKAYGITPRVLYSPVTFRPDGPQVPTSQLRDRYLLLVARRRSYKGIELAESFAEEAKEHVVIVGASPLEGFSSKYVTYLPSVSDDQLRWLYHHCDAVLGLSYEDFGLTPLEGNLCGAPTLAWAAGGYLETVVDGRSGALFHDRSTTGIRQGLSALRSSGLSRDEIVGNALRFHPDRFKAGLRATLDEVVQTKSNKFRGG